MLGAERHAASAVAEGLGRQTAAGLDALDVIVGLAGGPVTAAARRALAAMARDDGGVPTRGAGWLHQLAMADRLADKARVTARFGLRFVPGMLPPPSTAGSTEPAEPGEVDAR